MNQRDFEQQMIHVATLPIQALARAMSEMLATIDAERADARRRFALATTAEEIQDCMIELGYWGGAEFVAQGVVDSIQRTVPA